MQGHLRKTKGFTQAGETQKYIDIRQAAGELRTFRDYINDPGVVAVKVVPSATGGRSPDMFLRYGNGDTSRVEISNITLASPDYRPDVRPNAKGQLAPKIPKQDIPGQPGQTQVALPTNEFDDSAIKAAIRGKIKASRKGPSQLEAQNPNTRAGGAAMAPGGDVVVQITHGEVNKARLDQMIKELEPELLASSARRVQIDSIDAAEPRAGRKIFEYNREGQKFVGIVRKPNRPPLELPLGQKPGAMGAPRGMSGIIKGVGGTIIGILAQLAYAFIISKIAQKIEEAQIERELKKLDPHIGEKLNALSGDVLERQSASEQSVYATIPYSLNYMRTLTDPASRQLFFGESEHDINTNQSFHEQMAEQTFFTDAKLGNIKITSGEQPKDQSSFSLERDKYGTYETHIFTFEKSVKLQRFSNTELRDYILQQALAEEMNAPEGAPPSDRSVELRKRLDTMQGTIAKEEEGKRAEAESERLAEEKRKQEKLAQAREAQKVPPLPSPPLLPQPGSTPQPLFTPQNDPFNLGGRLQQKSLFEQAQDSVDMAEALKAEFVKKAEALRQENPSGEKVELHKKAVEEWIKNLRLAFNAWKTKGNPDWQAVKRMEFLVWWVDQPEGKAALMR
ncbi:hypothetical protein ACG10_09840 [Azotobacter chroococcum]|nr:hypothetical protein ACG10_09840 [Azotobacter chroococcum]